MQSDPSKSFQKAVDEGVAVLGQHILQALVGFIELEQIVLFGSLARGAGNPNSDIDVAVEADKPLTPE